MGILHRREYFQQVAGGLCGAALAHLFASDLLAALPAGNEPFGNGARPSPAASAPRMLSRFGQARSVVHLFMNGGPSQMDLFDPKPALERHHGEPHFDKIAGEVEFPMAAGALMRSMFAFQQHGQCGMWISSALPHLARHADDIALLRGMYTTNLTHEPAIFKVHSGQEVTGHPSLGSWVTYGLGSENQNLPAYVVLDDPKGLPINKTQSWSNGYLPPLYQGTRFRSTGSPVLNLKPDYEEPTAITAQARNLLRRIDRHHLAEHPHLPQLEARLESYELAARMQLAAADAVDLSGETEATLQMYGIGKEPTDSYGRRCLLTRRLIERGVRFVQLFIDGQIWDNHTGLADSLKTACDRTDLPIAGLLADLKQRGLLESTLIVWGGEFGRLPIAQLPDDKDEKKAGRDHNKNAMVSWMAGGGVKGGITYGETDELGFAAVAEKVSVPDWHATILYLSGLEHDTLFFLRNGLRNRLTGVNEARVVSEILA